MVNLPNTKSQSPVFIIADSFGINTFEIFQVLIVRSSELVSELLGIVNNGLYNT